MSVAYYPGCSLESSSEAYDLSVKAVCERLEITLETIDDWNCCGATEASALGNIAAKALIARNLARIPKDTRHVVAPCAACYLNLKKTDKLLGEHPDMNRKVQTALAAGGLSYEPGRLQIQHLLDHLVEGVGEQGFRDRVDRPLYGLRVAPYYGCQTVRPDHAVENPEYPRRLDDLLRWLGATVVDFPLKTHCCGGHMTQISDEMSNELVRRLLKTADDWDADVVATLCPMCQLNLDAYQGRVNNAFNTRFNLPILFFTQLVGLAFGMSHEALGIGKEIVAAGPVLDAKLQAAPDKPPRQQRPPKKGSPELPMPDRNGGAQ